MVDQVVSPAPETPAPGVMKRLEHVERALMDVRDAIDRLDENPKLKTAWAAREARLVEKLEELKKELKGPAPAPRPAVTADTPRVDGPAAGSIDDFLGV